jgi:hypothetical protein
MLLVDSNSIVGSNSFPLAPRKKYKIHKAGSEQGVAMEAAVEMYLKGGVSLDAVCRLHPTVKKSTLHDHARNKVGGENFMLICFVSDLSFLILLCWRAQYSSVLAAREARRKFNAIGESHAVAKLLTDQDRISSLVENARVEIEKEQAR